MRTLINVQFGCPGTHVLQGKAKKVVQAQKLWFAVLEAQIETGNPYILFKVLSCVYCFTT